MGKIQIFFRGLPHELNTFLAECGVKASLGLPPELALKELAASSDLSLSGLIPAPKVPVGAQVLHAISPETAKKHEMATWGSTRPEKQRVVKFSLLSPTEHREKFWRGTPHPIVEVGFEFTCFGVPDVWVQEALPHVRWMKMLWDIPPHENEANSHGVCGATMTSWDGYSQSVHIPTNGRTFDKKFFLQRNGWVDSTRLEFSREYFVFPYPSISK